MLAMAMAMAVASCPAEPAGDEAAAASPKAEGVATGSVRGTVVWAGEAVASPLAGVKVEADPTCVDGWRVPPPIDAGPVGGVVVWLEGGAAPEPPEAPLGIRFEGCRLWPEVQCGRVGQRADEANLDRTAHYAVSSLDDRRRGFHSWQGAPPSRIHSPVDRAGIVEIGCTVHPWEKAHIVYLETDLCRVTEGSGRFTFDEAPAGRYDLVAWHPQLGRITRPLEVEAGHVQQIELALAPAREP